MEYDTPETLKDYLNQQLEISDGHEGFRTEGQRLGEIFKQHFGYEIEEYAIPLTRSYLQLHNFITQSLLSVVQNAEEKGGASLLIIHYGGHGDENRSKGEEKRAVWAANNTDDSPLLEWFRIQEDIKNAETDILLLFDCCYAAQAARAREARPARIELLAAAAMGMKTLMPGSGSFTMVLARELQRLLEERDHVLVTDLHYRLVDRKANLWATPIYVKLNPGGQWTIKLEPMSKERESALGEESSRPFLQLLVRTQENLKKAHIHDIARWLGTNVPKTVTSLHVNDVVMTTTKLHTFMNNVRKGREPLTKALDDPALQDIISAWDDVVMQVEQYSDRFGETTLSNENMTLAQKRASMFLLELSKRNSDFMNTAQRNILNSSELCSQDRIQKAIESPAAETLELLDQLRLRQIVYSSFTSPDGFSPPPPSGKSSGHSSVMQEYKTYGENIDSADMEDMKSHVQRLSELLDARKDEAFLSMRCIGWHQDLMERRFVLDFEIPACYDHRTDKYHTLKSLIRAANASMRPSLNVRLCIALQLAKAVLRWHSVGWVHQSISGPNILFFTDKKTHRVDFNSPFLQGFEFARPKSDPSLGRSMNDISFNVYRHPHRQGMSRRSHQKTHDLYSLGVVLLEIGLWRGALDIFLDKRENVPGRQQVSIVPQKIKEKLLDVTRSRLAHYAGTSYKTAVEICLTGEFGVALDDSNDSYLARAFQHLVIDKLAEGVQFEDRF